MRLSTALTVAATIFAAKALLIGVVHWRRAEIMGRPIDGGTAAVALIAVVVLAVTFAMAALLMRRR